MERPTTTTTFQTTMESRSRVVYLCWGLIDAFVLSFLFVFVCFVQATWMRSNVISLAIWINNQPKKWNKSTFLDHNQFLFQFFACINVFVCLSLWIGSRCIQQSERKHVQIAQWSSSQEILVLENLILQLIFVVWSKMERNLKSLMVLAFRVSQFPKKIGFVCSFQISKNHIDEWMSQTKNKPRTNKEQNRMESRLLKKRKSSWNQRWHLRWQQNLMIRRVRVHLLMLIVETILVLVKLLPQQTKVLKRHHKSNNQQIKPKKRLTFNFQSLWDKWVWSKKQINTNKIMVCFNDCFFSNNTFNLLYLRHDSNLYLKHIKETKNNVRESSL